MTGHSITTFADGFPALERNFYTLVKSSLTGMVLVNREGVVLYANPAAEKLLGRSLEVLTGSPFGFPIVSGETVEILIRRPSSMATAEMQVAEMQWRNSTTYLISLYDITERKLAEIAVRKLEQSYRELIEYAPIGIFTSTFQGKFISANTKLAEIYGYKSVADLIDSIHDIGVQLYVDQSDREKVLTAAERGLANRLEIQRRRKDGSFIWVALSMRVVRDDSGNIICYEGFTRDITERKQMEKELQDFATLDFLTGLNNRRHSLELGKLIFDASKRYGSDLTVAIFDIDSFKAVNDTHGHGAGDMVLKMLGKTALESFRSADILGRIGGEEFAVIMPQTRYPEALNAMDRFRRGVESILLEYEGTPLSITISCGVALLASTDSTLESLLKKADEALYRAKNNGKNMVVAFDIRFYH